MSTNIMKKTEAVHFYLDDSPAATKPRVRAVQGSPLAASHEFAWLLSEPEERKNSFSVGDDVAPYKL